MAAESFVITLENVSYSPDPNVGLRLDDLVRQLASFRGLRVADIRPEMASERRRRESRREEQA